GRAMMRGRGGDGWLSAVACGAAATAVSTSVSAKTAMRCMAVLPLDAAYVVQRTGCRQTSRFACASRDWRNDLMLIDRKSDGDVASCHTTSLPGLIGRSELPCGHGRNDPTQTERGRLVPDAGISSTEIGLLDGSPLRASGDCRQRSIERLFQDRVHR